MKIYTRKGDDGTTGLYFGSRVPKDSARPSAYGDVDEAQAFIGFARAALITDAELNEVLVSVERDLWVLMADLATAAENADKLTDGQTKVTTTMVARLESIIDDYTERTELPQDFVVPGETERAARLDCARTVVRRAERAALGIEDVSPEAIAYLNRLSDLLWVLARYCEHVTRLSKEGTSP